MDEPLHLLLDHIQNLVHLIGRPFHDQLHSPVGQVFDVAADVVADGDVVRGVSKADALDVAAEVARSSTDGWLGAHEREYSRRGLIR